MLAVWQFLSGATMTELQKCNFFLLRYVPDAVKNEFVNVGLVLVPPAGLPELRFTRDLSRMRCLDPDADLELLEVVESDLREKLRSSNGDRDSILRKIQDSFSNGLQASDIKACLAESPSLDADELARIYLERAPRRRAREAGPRQVIFDRMRKEFETAGVWEGMRHDIRAAGYTRSGDPLKIDCGYTSAGNGLVKMFHAVALPGDTNTAKLLAFTFPRLAEGIRKRDGLSAQLTAIIDDDLPQDEESVNFALDTLAQQDIAVATLAQMPGIAMQAAREIG
jgi:hypothetical protein